ncbi:hypothetical protein [Legionella cardiaca]|uniref:Ankyrin repeat protein n=1 Tax=Legionella cardiaca TaxID=1071983 RepID=A0ABY8AXC6_9GAMM|nr:hypothetical protein [Legionella cardiaca]WED44394.1 hypothetical protein PXX05_06300 [Legionella cardiaca]
MGRRVKEGKYTSIADSAVDKLLNRLKPILADLQKKLDTRPEYKKRTIENEFTKNQFAALARIIKVYDDISSNFANGNQPNMAWLLLKNPGLLSDMTSVTNDLSSTHQTIYNLLKKDLASITETAYKAAQKSDSSVIIESFKEELKKAIRKKLANLGTIIPCTNLEKYLLELDRVIDEYDIKNHLSNKSEFIENLKLVISRNFVKDHKKMDFKVVHPISYELIAKIFPFLHEIPAELEDLASFFHPGAGNIPKKVSHVTEKAPSDYTYLVKGEVIDAEEAYRKYRVLLPSILSGKLIDYFEDYKDTLHVRSELAKMNMIREFIHAENKLLEEKTEQFLKDFSTGAVESPHSEALSSIDPKVAADGAEGRLEEELAVFKENEFHIKALIDELTQKLMDYKGKSLRKLLDSHSELAERLVSEASNHDVTYANEILPDLLLVKKTDASFGLLAVQENLARNLQMQKMKLEGVLEHLQENRNRLVLNYHQKRNADISQQLEKLDKAIAGFENFAESSANDLEALERQFSMLEMHYSNVLSIQDELNKLLQIWEHPFYCPSYLKQGLYPAIINIYSANKMALTGHQHTVVKILGFLESQKLELIQRLEKERAAQSMKSANREAFTELQFTKKELLAKKQEEEKSITRVLEDLNEKTIQATKLENDDELQQSKSKRSLMAQSVWGEVTKHKETLSQLGSLDEQKFDRLFALSTLESDQTEKTLLWLEELISTEEKKDKQSTGNKDYFESKRQIQTALMAVSQAITAKKSPLVDVLKNLDELTTFSIKKFYGISIFKRGAGIEVLAKILQQEKEEIERRLACDELSESIDEAKDLVTNQIKWAQQSQDNLLLYKSRSVELLNIKKALEPLVTVNKTIAKKEQEIALVKSDLEQEINKNKEALAQTKTDISNINLEIRILEKIDILLLDVQKLNDYLSTTSENPDQKCNEAEKQFEPLIQASEEIKKLIDEVKSSEYEVSITAIHSVLKTAVKRIANLKIASFNEKFNTISVALDSLPEMSDLKLTLLKEQLINFNIYSQAIQPAFQNIELLQRRLSKTFSEQDNDGNAKTSVSTESGAEGLVPICRGKQELLLQEITTCLEQYKTQIETQKQTLGMTFNETCENKKVHAEAILALKAYLPSIKEEELSHLSDELEKLQPASKGTLGTLNEVINAINLLKKQVEKHEVILNGQKDRIMQRRELVQKFSGIFKEYLQKRHGKYAFKDFFNNADALKRESFIQKLSEEMKGYEETGDGKKVIDYIFQNRNQFHGLTLQPILSRLIIDMTDLGKKIPTSQENYIFAVDPVSTDVHEDALIILKNHEEAHPKLSNALSHLYNAIEVLEQHGVKIGKDGQMVQDLAIRLRKKVDALIYEHPDNLPTPDEYNAFHADFMEHLHSHDDVMSKHRSFWKPFIVNLALALVSVGIALGVKLLTSKRTDGYASFFVETKRFQHVKELDMSLEDVAKAAAAA